MLTLITNSGGKPLKVDDYYIKELASGLNELCFTISIWDEDFQTIQEEQSILEQSGNQSAYYLVKAIDSGVNTANVKCQIDIDEWKASLVVGYKSASLSVGAMVRSISPPGWTVVDASGMTYQRTIELTSATPLDVLEQCRSTFSGVTYRFDNVSKTIEIINYNDGQNLGVFVTRELNLKELQYKGKSTGFATRLYAVGKSGLTFADINGGLPYVDDNTYSSRVICAFWKDERYTIAENLLQAARDKLADMAVPQRSYECSVVDLAKSAPDKFSELDFKLFDTVTLIDQTRSNAQIPHTVVELWRYPYLPQNNKVVLSTVAPRIQSQVAQIVNNLNNDNSEYQQQQTSAQETAIENATAKITGADGGVVRSIYDENGNWTELVIMNTNDILTATKVWRWNIGGFGYSPNGYNGPYTTAITMDGAIVANFITTGTLDASKVTVSNLSASSITTGTLDASRVTVTNLSASAITTGTLDASKVTVTNLSANSITSGTINADNINVTNINGQNIKGKTITGSKVADSTVTGTNIASYTVSGGTDGNIATSTVTTTNVSSGISTNLGYAASYGTATAYSGSTGPDYFNCYQINCTSMVFNSAGISLLWSDTLGHFYLGSGGEG